MTKLTRYALTLTPGLTLALAQPTLAAPAAEGDAEGEISILNFGFGSAIWNLIVFILLLFVLGKFVWPHILKALQDREQKQEQDLKSAETAATEAKQTLEKYKQQLAEAQQESQRIIAESRQEAQRVADQQKQQTQADIDKMRDRAQKDIEAAKQRAVEEVYEQAATLSTQIAAQILQREVKPEDQRQLIDSSLQQFKNRQN